MSINKFRTALARVANLEMTLYSLGLMMFLVFFGTLAQVNIGTFAAQQKYFNSFFVWGTPFGFPMPVLPGGLLVGGVWFINLVAAFIVRFQFIRRNTGIIVSHLGLIILLLGQFLTQTMARESQMAIEIGQTRSYSENSREAEMVFIDKSRSDYEEIVSIPQSIFSKKRIIRTPQLPFSIHVKSFYHNADLHMLNGMEQGAATEGIGARIKVVGRPPVSADDEINSVSAVVDIMEGNKKVGNWLLSMNLGARQSFFVQDKEYELAIRPKRTYYPFKLTLKEFHHDRYPGTQIPKNFSSLVHLVHPEKNENRDVLIYMNHPLRYDGKTFYQSSFGKNDTLSIFQIVENPFWLTPYLSCVMVLLGLAIQFLSHLVGFIKGRP